MFSLLKLWVKTSLCAVCLTLAAGQAHAQRITLPRQPQFLQQQAQQQALQQQLLQQQALANYGLQQQQYGYLNGVQQQQNAAVLSALQQQQLQQQAYLNGVQQQQQLGYLNALQQQQQLGYLNALQQRQLGLQQINPYVIPSVQQQQLYGYTPGYLYPR